MNRSQGAELEARVKDALRAQIGEQRYMMWFGQGVRFAFQGDSMLVSAGSEFLAGWLRTSFGRALEGIARAALGEKATVAFEFEQPAAQAVAAGAPVRRQAPARVPDANITAPEQPDLLPFPAPADRVPNTLPNSLQPEYVPLANPGTPALDATPKRKRGRPRKNPAPQPAPVPTASFAPSPQPAIQSAPATLPFPGAPAFGVSPFAPAQAGLGEAAFGQTALGQEYAQFAATTLQPAQPVPAFSPVPQQPLTTPQPPAEPPKRKRGRPRKNPLPEQSQPVASPVPTQPAPFGVQPGFGVAANGLAEAYAAAAQDRSASAPTASAPENLSELERVAWAVGTFDEPVQPKRRGRPKGSTNRRNQAPAVAQVEPSDEGAEVLRDANGYNVVRLPKEAPARRPEDGTGRRYASLSTFVTGFSNQLAKKALEIAMLQPGAMNPILLSGPTSVGKTHLLEGVCEAFSRRRDARPPLYMTAEQFTTLFIQSLRGGGAFRERFRNISLFALDDVHFLEGKRSTQTELLNIYDFLSARGVQMIFSSNRPLSELTDLRGELTTRLQSGMSCRIEVPERETLAQIFRQMATERGLAIPEEVCRYTVSRFATHARHLSGALNRLYAAHLTTGSPITVDLARSALSDMEPAARRSVTLEDVERVVQETFGLEGSALKSSSRAKKCSDPRALAMWLARRHTRAALSEIGEFFGGRRHSSVISASKKVDGWLERQETVASNMGPLEVGETIQKLERALAAG